MCCWGALAWKPEKDIYSYWFSKWIAFYILYIKCHQHHYLLPVFFGMPLGHTLFGCTFGVPRSWLCNLKHSRTQPAWLDYQSMSKKAAGKKASIASWGNYHAPKKIVTKYLARKQAFRRFSNIAFGKQCWHGAREHAVPGLWCVLYFPQGRAVLGSVLGQSCHIRCCSAVLSGLQPPGSIFLWLTGTGVALPPPFHFTFFAVLLVSGLGHQSKVRDTVQAALCSSEMFFHPTLYAHSEPIFNFSQSLLRQLKAKSCDYSSWTQFFRQPCKSTSILIHF